MNTGHACLFKLCEDSKNQIYNTLYSQFCFVFYYFLLKNG